MRTVAKFSMHARLSSSESARDRWQTVRDVVDGWIESKGELSDSSGGFSVIFRDGRSAQLELDVIEVENGALASWQLDEPTNSGAFSTDVQTAIRGTELFVYCELRAGSDESGLAPIRVVAHAPKFVREIHAIDCEWMCGNTAVTKAVQQYRGPSGAEFLRQSMFDSDRGLPIVVISESDGLVLHPGLEDDIHYDLSGLASVCKIDEEASWELSRLCGVKWSCYNGAIRVYWPRMSLSDSPFRHPLWTADRLLAGADSTKHAAQRLRQALRERVFEAATFALQVPEIARAIRMEHARAKGDVDYWFKTAERYEKDIERLKSDVGKLVSDNENLRTQLEHYKAQNQSNEAPASLPDTERPPETVAEAVNRAREGFSDEICFGSDVDRGVAGLSPNAGPPDKVLRFLRTLAEMVHQQRRGSLGTNLTKWLTDRKCNTTGESETIRNNKAEQKRRTWDDGTGSVRTFDLHMKPSDGTSPDRCVRIYFEYDKDRRVAVVGWVGRKPGL